MVVCGTEENMRSWAVGPTAGLKGEQTVGWAFPSIGKYPRTAGSEDDGGVTGLWQLSQP